MVCHSEQKKLALQDIGLMDKNIRPLWRDVEKFFHRVIGFAITIRHVPTNVRVGQNSFPDLVGFKKFKAQQYKRVPDAWRDTDEIVKVKKNLGLL